jgi:hypothetical protein
VDVSLELPFSIMMERIFNRCEFRHSATELLENILQMRESHSSISRAS